MTYAKSNFNQLMLTLIFAIRASEPPLGPGERLKRPGLVELKFFSHNTQIFSHTTKYFSYRTKIFCTQVKLLNFKTLNISLSLLTKFCKTNEVLMKVFVSIKYFLYFLIVKLSKIVTSTLTK